MRHRTPLSLVASTRQSVRFAVVAVLVVMMVTSNLDSSVASTAASTPVHRSHYAQSFDRAHFHQRGLHAVTQGRRVVVFTTLHAPRKTLVRAVGFCVRRPGQQWRAVRARRNAVIGRDGRTVHRALHLRVGVYRYRSCVRVGSHWHGLKTVRQFRVTDRHRHGGPLPSPTPSPTTPAPTTPAPTTPAPTTPAPTTPAPTTPAPTTPAPTPTDNGTVPPAGALTPEQFGAVGNGVADDTAALQRALDAVPSGGTLWIAPGKVYAHSAVLNARRAGETIAGAGTILATQEATSSFWVSGDNITVSDVTFRTAATTKRWDAYEQMGVRIAGASGTVLRRITVAGSAAAGIYVGQSCCTPPSRQAANFLIDGVTVSDTRADGIHMTGGSHDGVVRNVTVSNSGDDGVAVVSYAQDGVICNHIAIESPTVTSTSWGRGLSVVGGEYITYSNINVTASDSAGLYISQEGAPFYTASSKHIVVNGGTITDANTNANIGHGAIMMWGASAGYAINDVQIANLTITKLRSSAPWEVGMRTGGADISGVTFSNIRIAGTPTPFATNVAGSGYALHSWIVNQLAVPDHN